MSTYIILRQIKPKTVLNSTDILPLRLNNKITNECQGIDWKECYATLGCYDFIDIFDTNDLRQVEKTIMIMSDDENFNTNLLFANSLKSISGE